MSEEAPADPPLETFIRRVEGLGAAPLERLRAAIDAAERLSEVADHLVGHFVDEARLSGASWADIGGCLGVTRQAVQKRFVPRGEIAGGTDRVAWERFTPRVRSTVALAKQAARDAGHAEVQPTHLLMGLMEDATSVAAKAIAAQGVTPAVVRRVASAALPQHDDGDLPTQPLLSSGTNKALALASRNAIRLGHPYVGTEHVLLALHELQDTGALLSGVGLDRTATESEVHRALGK